ncbi:MAG: hypothetical protein AB8I08_34875 [Sandaracinaceae bacterium]
MPVATHTARVEAALSRFGSGITQTLGEPATADFDMGSRRALIALDERDVVLAIARDGRGFSEHPQLVLSHPSCSPGDARFLASRPWQPDAIRNALDALEEELAFEPARLPIAQALDDMGREGSTLRPWAMAFERHYGQAIQAWDLGGETPSVCFPVVATDQNTFLHTPAEFERARMQAYIMDRGYAVADGLLRVVPLPASLVPPEGGLEARFIEHAPFMVSPGRWVRSVLAGTLPINIFRWPTHHGLSGRFANLSARVHPEVRTMWNSHFCALGHDMSLHAFSFHRMGASAWQPVRQALRGLLRTRREQKTAADFIEGPLTRHCVSLWYEATFPEQFDSLFTERLPELLSQLPPGTHELAGLERSQPER